MGSVPIAEYGTPSTAEIPDHIEKYLPNYDAILLESHGALTWSADLLSAYHKMESLEFYAEVLYRTQMLGGGKELSGETIEKLYEVRRKMNLPGKHPANL
ncbi:MAG: class II aldolase/adducin family protein, partial [Oscillospiraceae bacterium]